MTGRQCERILKKYVLPILPGFVAKGRLMIRDQFEGILHVYYFDYSTWERDIMRPSVCVIPLYIPTDVIHVSFGANAHEFDTRDSQYFKINPEDPMGESSNLPDIVEYAKSTVRYFRKANDSIDFEITVKQTKKVSCAHLFKFRDFEKSYIFSNFTI